MFEIIEKTLENNQRDLKQILLSHIKNRDSERIYVNLIPIIQEFTEFIYYETFFLFDEQEYCIYIYNKKYYDIKSATEDKWKVYRDLDLSENYILVSVIDFSINKSGVDDSRLNKYFVYIFLVIKKPVDLKPKWDFYKYFEKETDLTPYYEFLYTYRDFRDPAFEIVGFGYQNNSFKIYLKDSKNIVHESVLEDVIINNNIINDYNCYFSKLKMGKDTLNILIAENEVLLYLKKLNNISVSYKSNNSVLENIIIPLNEYEPDKFFIYPLTEKLFTIIFSNDKLIFLSSNTTEFKIKYLFNYKFKTPLDYFTHINKIFVEDMHRLEAESYEEGINDNAVNPWEDMDEEYQRKLDEDWIWKKMDEADREDELIEQRRLKFEKEMYRREILETKLIKAGISQEIKILSIDFIEPEQNVLDENSEVSLKYFDVVYVVPTKQNNYKGDVLEKSSFYEQLNGIFMSKIRKFIYIIIPNHLYEDKSIQNVENYFNIKLTLVHEINYSYSLSSELYPLRILKYDQENLF